MGKFSEDVPREVVKALENQAFDIAKIKARLQNQISETLDIENRLSVLEQYKDERVDIQEPNFGEGQNWVICPRCKSCFAFESDKPIYFQITCSCGHTITMTPAM